MKGYPKVFVAILSLFVFALIVSPIQSRKILTADLKSGDDGEPPQESVTKRESRFTPWAPRANENRGSSPPARHL